ADDGAVPVGGLDRLNRDFGGGGGKRGEDAAGVEPADAELSENVIPVEVTGLQLRGRGVAAIGAAHGAADAEAPFGEVEPVADGAADAIVLAPFDEVGGDAALHDEILDQVSDLVVDEGGADGGLVAETFPQPPRRVIFTAALPDGEMPRGADAALA